MKKHNSVMPRFDDNFKASSEWLDEFKNNLLRNTIEKMRLCLDQIYNADGSGLFWKLLPQRNLLTMLKQVET